MLTARKADSPGGPITMPDVPKQKHAANGKEASRLDDKAPVPPAGATDLPSGPVLDPSLAAASTTSAEKI